VAVSLLAASDAGHALIDRELEVPRGWINDADRCRAASIPAQVGFATKPQLATRMLTRTLDAGDLSPGAGWPALAAGPPQPQDP
jgi:SRSO17 transposase